MRDVRLAVRSLARSPRFTFAALLALGLGIGATTTVFSVADGLLFRSLPYRDPDRLVSVSASISARGFSNWDVPATDFDAWREATPMLAGMAGHHAADRLTLMLPGAPEDLMAVSVTPGLLSVLGVSPAIGRDFIPDEFTPGAPTALLLTDGAWRRLFQSDRAVIGRPLTINDGSGYVVGVLPRTFAFPGGSRRWLPEALIPSSPGAAAQVGIRLKLVGRLAPGASIDRARVDLDGFARAHGGKSGLANAPIDGATVYPLETALISSSHTTLMILLVGAVAALLLIGCANVANLLVARGADRAGEMSLRAALGASRGALVRLLLTESVVLAAAGGAVGVLLAFWAVSVVAPLVPDDLKRLKDIAIDTRAVGVAAGVSALCVLLCGLLPAIRLAGRNMLQSIAGASSRATPGRLRARQILVGLEVALATVLLVGGALMANAMVRLLSIDHGYDPGPVLTMRVQLPGGTATPDQYPEFVQRVLAGLRATPGVTVAGAIGGAPLEWTLYGGIYSVEGFSRELEREDATVSGVCCTQSPKVSADYFAALGVSVVRGRAFTPSDRFASPRVALINEKLARKFPAGVDPVGHFVVADDPTDRRVIVGGVRDIRDMRLEDRAMQAIYLPLEERGRSSITVAIRTAGPPMAMAGAVRTALQQGAGPVVISDVRTLDELLMRSVSPRRLNAWLFGSFGVMGLLLAATGIYGVISYAVAQRTRELGVRLALGASPSRVRRLVVRQSVVPVAAGLVAGLGASLALSRYVASLLYEVAPRDLTTYVIVSAVLGASGLLAAYLPARRASRIDPMIALRAE